MTEEEIVRRLRALIAMKASERPVSIYLLAQLATISPDQVKDIAARGTMWERNRQRLSRALTLIENNQVTQKKIPNKPSRITIGAPNPPQLNVSIVRFTKEGPRVRSLALNPLRFDTPQSKAEQGERLTAPPDQTRKRVWP